VKDDPFRIIENRVKTIIRQGLLDKNRRKTFDLLGYSREDLVDRLKKTLTDDFTWEDFALSPTKFHIDHIIPRNNYKNNEEEYLKKCWNLRNLRLITAEKNYAREHDIDMKLVEEYEIEDLLPENFLCNLSKDNNE